MGCETSNLGELEGSWEKAHDRIRALGDPTGKLPSPSFPVVLSQQPVIILVLSNKNTPLLFYCNPSPKWPLSAALS